MTHANLTSLVRWHREAFGVSAADRASHVAGLGFDASVWELWPYLAAGASVHLADQIARHSPELLRDWLVAARITMSFVPTPLAERILAIEWPRETALRFLLTGGDALHHYPPSTLPFRVVNNYGPTECTVVATSGEISQSDQPDSLPPIGTAIAQTQIYLLDENFREVPDGSIGEMYIGGPSVARGYRNRPDLTGERFIANPFGRGRLYRTGDLARRLPGGAFAFMGRADEQIKIRGYRIEPKEIVHALNRHPEIRDSLVIARPARGESEKRLIAYITAAPGARLTHTGLRDALRDVLPEYMLPAVFVTIAEFPTTHNGKVDLARLPEPSPENTLSDEAAGAEILSPTEQTVAKIVTGLLGLDAVARDDNFFLLGGHSLLAAQLIARLRDACGVEIPLRTVFATPTVAMLAEYIDRSAGHAAAACAMTKPAA